jgi:hypothetical protein
LERGWNNSYVVPNEYEDYRDAMPMSEEEWKCFKTLCAMQLAYITQLNNHSIARLKQLHKDKYIIDKLREWAAKAAAGKPKRTSSRRLRRENYHYHDLQRVSQPPLMKHDRFGKLRQRVTALDRELAELNALLANASKLRAMADEVEAEFKRKEKERAEQERKQQEEFAQFMRGKYGNNRDPLDVLNLPANATPEQIRARFRALCKQLHPDTNRGDDAASGLLRQVTEAMEQLRAQGRA